MDGNKFAPKGRHNDVGSFSGVKFTNSVNEQKIHLIIDVIFCAISFLGMAKFFCLTALY